MNKAYLLLIVLFLIYIGTGSGISLLGSAWPAISLDILAPLTWQSILLVIIYLSATAGAACAQRLLAWFRDMIPSALGILMLVISIFGFAATYSFYVIAALSVLLGFSLGLSGAIVNGYVTRHYATTWMSWLHCCFAVGCMIGPAVISYFIINVNSWRMGYQAVGFVELGILVVLIASFSLWRVHGPAFAFPRIRRKDAETAASHSGSKVVTLRILAGMPGGMLIPVIIFFHASFEVSIFSWSTTFMTEERGLTPGAAAGIMAVFYGAQLGGRVISGLVTIKVRDRIVLNTALVAALAATILFLIAPDNLLTFAFIVLGVVTGPLFPLFVHDVPSIVGDEKAQGAIGIQIAAANLGNTFIPLLIGVVAGIAGFRVFPVFLLILVGLSLSLKIAQNRIVRKSGNINV